MPTKRNTPTALDAILAAVTATTDSTQHNNASAFTNAFYRRMSEDESPLHTPDEWAALALDLLNFARKRKPGTANVRVFNPTLKTHGWESAHTVVQVVNDDMPFLVDSVTMALAAEGIGVHVLGHPLIPIARDVGSGNSESVMHLEIDRQTSEDITRLEQNLTEVLNNVRVIVRDWREMREKMQQVSADLGGDSTARANREAQEFLRWAAN